MEELIETAEQPIIEAEEQEAEAEVAIAITTTAAANAEPAPVEAAAERAMEEQEAEAEVAQEAITAVTVPADAQAEAKERRAAAAAAELMRGVVASMQVGKRGDRHSTVRTIKLTEIHTRHRSAWPRSWWQRRARRRRGRRPRRGARASRRSSGSRRRTWRRSRRRGMCGLWCVRSKIESCYSNVVIHALLFVLFPLRLRDTLEARAAEEGAKASQAQEELQTERAEVCM